MQLGIYLTFAVACVSILKNEINSIAKCRVSELQLAHGAEHIRYCLQRLVGFILGSLE